MNPGVLRTWPSAWMLLDDGSPDYPDICDTKKDNELFKKGGVDKVLYDAISYMLFVNKNF